MIARWWVWWLLAAYTLALTLSVVNDVQAGVV